MISERMKRRIEKMPDDQLIDWICLYCVDVRNTYSDDDAQEFINDIRAALEQRLNATAQPVSDECKVPEGWKLVPIVPSWEMLSADGCKEHHNGQKCLHHDNRRRIWAAMLAAAPGGQD